MKLLHCIIALVGALFGLLGLVAGPLAFVALLLLAAVIGAMIFVRTMNRQQQEEIRQAQLRKNRVGSPDGTSGPLVL